MKLKLDSDYANILISDLVDENQEFIPIISGEENESPDETVYPKTLPILPLRNTVLFPGVVIPIAVGRPKSLKLIKEAYKKEKLIGTVAQKDVKVEDPTSEDIFKLG